MVQDLTQQELTEHFEREYGHRVIRPRLAPRKGVFAIVNERGEPIHPGDLVFNRNGDKGTFGGVWLNPFLSWFGSFMPEDGAENDEIFAKLDFLVRNFRLVAPTKEAIEAVIDETFRRKNNDHVLRSDVNAVMHERDYPPFQSDEALNDALNQGRDPELDVKIMEAMETLLRPAWSKNPELTLEQTCKRLGMTCEQAWAQAALNAGVVGKPN